MSTAAAPAPLTATLYQGDALATLRGLPADATWVLLRVRACDRCGIWVVLEEGDVCPWCVEAERPMPGGDAPC